jgi:uncharacterized membrane protein YhaH (DUF805 family)
MSESPPTFPIKREPARRVEWIRPDLFWAMCLVPLAVIVAVVGIAVGVVDAPAAAFFVVAAIGVLAVVALALWWAMIARRAEAPGDQWALGVVVVVATVGMCALVAYGIYEIIRTAR